MIPSIRTLERAFPGQGKQLRRALTDLSFCESLPKTAAWVRTCYHRPRSGEIRMAALDEILGGFGVEYVEAGSNAKSPAFHYVNLGDTYTITIVRICAGHYRVTDWGSIVERGNYA